MDQRGAEHWVVHRDRYDRMYEPFQDALLAAADIRSGESVLDVGCGYGTTTLAAAALARPGPVTGIDLSPTMLALARAGAAGTSTVSFVEDDAQTHDFPPSSFDVVVSRFGVMFFADPLAAFATLRRATRPGGRLAFVAWRSPADQPWLCVPGAAVARYVELPDLTNGGGPGMFALADADRVRALLGAAGWTGVELAPVTTPLLLGRSPEDTVDFLRSGSLGSRTLDGTDADTEARALAEARAALARYTRPDGVRLDAGVWLVQARA
ncbi:class I SAM-dependent methyltransferase [Cellulomonas sp. ICMP 17802]|uniref:class I SAM-dependent methyltransferase n=1 Tax=Cellulomonas sp. ICMP 17802 TaxID=3239199 RepID=UPI00351B8743